MKCFTMCRLFTCLCAIGALGVATDSFASGFQLFEQDVTSIGNYHAGYAALADNASIAFYNPAGITLIKDQQLVLAGIGVFTNVKYNGTVAVSTLSPSDPQQVTVNGGVSKFIPAFHYVYPINDRVGFGFSVGVPFGLEVNYDYDTIMRYVSTDNMIKVIDVSPSLGFKVTDQASLGVGLDVQRMYGEFDQVGVFMGQMYDSDGLNQADDTAYGYHLGGMYAFTPDARAGLSYHSQVVHHLTGTSTFSGPLAGEEGLRSRNLMNITLPPYTALSFYDKVHPKVALMASAIYTQWSTIQNFILQNVTGLDGDPAEPSTNIVITIPQHLRNTWNFSLGADYYVTDYATLRGGVGYDQTPVSNTYRSVQLPDNNRYVIALGAHYQAAKKLGLDIGWTHLFINKAHIIPPTQVTGAEQININGSATGSADVYGAQLVWDIA